MAVSVAGLIAVIVFYVAILVVGIIAGRKTTRTQDTNEMFLANRNMGALVAFFTLTATMVGGGFINGTAEMMYTSGFVWVQAPIGYNLALIIGGFFFAEKVRRSGYVTMFDPFQNKYGTRIGALLFIPQLLGDLFWTASILSALGASLSVILGLNATISIIISACIAVAYTFLGGLYSVAYTDVLQMICIALGLFLAFPFALTNDAVDLSTLSVRWRGEVRTSEIGLFLDSYLLLIMGGIPWQTYFQRVLACRTPQIAKWASVGGGIAAAIQAIPPMAIGAAVMAADLNQTEYRGPIPITGPERSLILPIGLQYLCPTAVSVIGLGAVSAAVMSSADSCILSTSSVFAHNIWRNILRPNASNSELIWVLRVGILIAGILGSLIGIVVTTVYGLFFLCSDLIYVINFPQLVSVLWIRVSNSYGCIAGYLVGFFLRITGGEPLIGIPSLIKYPLYDEVMGQRFPFKTCAMLCSLFTIFAVSYVTDYVFRNGILDRKFDFLNCAVREDERPEALRDSDKDGDKRAPLATENISLNPM